MNIAQFKAQIVPPPAADFIGSELRIRTAPGSMTFGVYSAALASGHASISIDWGDGTVETFSSSVQEATHTYVAAGDRIIRLSDDISQLAFIGHVNPGIAFERFKNLPTAFASNATALVAIAPMCLAGCAKLERMDVSASAVSEIVEGAFAGCAKLKGEIRLPTVSRFPRSNRLLPFGDCTGGITRIHFAAANEDAIKSTVAYQTDPTLGTGTATLVFDL